MHNPAQPARRTHRASGPPGSAGAVGYALVLLVVAVGLVLTWHGTHYATRGATLVGCALLGAGLARLVLPPRYAGLLATRSKPFDVAAFGVLGGGVLGLALSLPLGAGP